MNPLKKNLNFSLECEIEMEKYKKFKVFLSENKGKRLKIERHYLPELVHDDLWQINAEDELPELTPIAMTTVRHWGVSLEIKNEFLIIFIPKNLFRKSEFDSHFV